MGELYGEVNKLTMEWKDGLMAVSVRHSVQVGVLELHVEEYTQEYSFLMFVMFHF